MTTRIKLRRDTATNWTTTNPILAAGEPGLETDTGKTKYGDGVSRWNVLDYSGGGSLTSTSSIEIETGDADRWFVRLRREDDEVDPGFKGVTVYSTNYDSEGNAIVVGRIELYSDDGVVVAKFTSAGDLVWKKSIGAVDNSRYPESNAVIDSDDNILLAVNPDDSQLKNIVKINGSTGAVMFSEELAFTDTLNIRAMAVDSNNNIIIGGYFDFNGDDTGFVAKLNPTATDITWQKSLTVDSGFSVIGSVAVDFNNDIIAVGGAEVEITVNGETDTNGQILVAKITSAGGLGWQKTVALDSETPFGGAFNVSLDSVGNSYVTGTYYVDNAESDSFSGYGGYSKKSNAVFLFKMTTLGAISWDRRVGPGSCDWVGVSTAVGDDGDLYLLASTYQRNSAGGADPSLGYWNATLALARYNKTTGAVVWQSYFDNPNSQETPGDVNDAPWDDGVADNISVQGDKILIGGAVRLGASGPDLVAGTPGTDEDYFTQGFVAQFDTAATAWSAEGWSLSTSRIPGRLTNTLVAVNGPTALQTDIAMTEEGSAGIVTQAVGISVRRTSSKVNTWTFGKDGTFTAPADADIRLQQRQLGSATMYGLFPNDESDIWFESVCHDTEGFAYVVGSDDWEGNRAHIYKFTPEGAVVWQRQLRSGDGAEFTVVVTTGTYATPTVTNGGNSYKVGDRILIDGDNLGGNASNTLVLEVETIVNSANYVGEVGNVIITSGTGASSLTNTYYSVQDFNDNAKCEIRSMAYNPVTGNIVVVITTPTQLGDSVDSGWTETVILTIDSGSGTVVSTTTLQDEGDIYAYDIDISSTGKIAVVGEKFNEYAEYGAITPLAGSGVDLLRVTKADIDTEHFPGESIPGGSSSGDWWITGTGITDQAQVTSVNYYEGLTGTVQQGSGAVFTVEVNGAVINTQSAMGNIVVGTETFGGNTAHGYSNITIPTFGSTTAASLAELYYVAEAPTPYTRLMLIPGTYDGFTVAANGLIANNTNTRNFVVVESGAEMTPEEVSPGVYVYFNRSGDVYNLALENTQTLAVRVAYSDIPDTAGSYSVLVTNGGTNYLPGHKVKVLGTALGGTTPENDVVITVDALTSNAISSVSRTGNANVAADGPYTSVAYTNHLTGTGAVFAMYFDPTDGTPGFSQVTTGGENYVVNDVITIAGTNFAGGTAPGNNIIITAATIDAGAITNFYANTGTHPTTHLQITTNANVDYVAVGAEFAIKQNLGGEAFVWTTDMTPVIGGASNDQFSGVAWNAAGTHLYAVGQGQYEVNYDQALVVKYAADGTIVASKFVNNNMGENNAYKGAVALMANDSIVVVHEMYNNGRDETDEVLVTKLDSSLNIIWQQFIGVEDGDGSWSSVESRISVAVDPASDEILLAWESYNYDIFDDDGIAIVKLDTDGEVVWKRMWGVYESDTRMCYEGYGNKALSIHGDQFTLVGYTDAPDDNTDNAFIVTLPLDGTGVGEQGIWKYAEPNDDRIKVWRLSGNTVTIFTATVQSSSITAAANVKYYYTDYPNEEFTFYPHTILSNEGGAIEFADGSRQTFSTAIVPQVRISAGGYTLKPEDSGRHILVESSNYVLVIPNWQKVSLPVGYTVTIVNISGSDAYVSNESSDNLRGQMWFSGGDDKTAYIGINDNGSGQMVTLIKIKEGTESDDADNHGDIWMVAGADIYNDD